MAYRLTRASSQFFTLGDLPPPTDGALSFGCWLKLASLPASNAGANRFSLVARVQVSNAAGYYAFLGSSVINVGFYNGAYIGADMAYTPDTDWHHIGIVWDFSTTTAELKAFEDGVLINSGTYTRGTVANTSPVSTIGSLSAGGAAGQPDGTFAEAAFWNASLTAADWTELAKGASPRRVRPSLLRRHWPLVRELNEIKQGTSITGSGAPTVTAHPRTYR